MYGMSMRTDQQLLKTAVGLFLKDSFLPESCPHPTLRTSRRGSRIRDAKKRRTRDENRRNRQLVRRKRQPLRKRPTKRRTTAIKTIMMPVTRTPTRTTTTITSRCNRDISLVSINSRIKITSRTNYRRNHSTVSSHNHTPLTHISLRSNSSTRSHCQSLVSTQDNRFQGTSSFNPNPNTPELIHSHKFLTNHNRFNPSNQWSNQDTRIPVFHISLSRLSVHSNNCPESRDTQS